MNRTISIAPVRKAVVVEATPARAFEIFTAGLDRWWPRTHGIGAAPITKSTIEPFVGGRWYSSHEDGKDVVIGHVRAWQPGVRFVVGWEISSDWKPDSRVEFASEVEVRFTAEGAAKTRVEVEHRDFERMGAAPGEKMRSGVDGGWTQLLDFYAAQVAREGES